MKVRHYVANFHKKSRLDPAIFRVSTGHPSSFECWQNMTGLQVIPDLVSDTGTIFFFYRVFSLVMKYILWPGRTPNFV